MFGPGFVLVAGALVLDLLPDHSARNTYCAVYGGVPDNPVCPLPSDHHPVEILEFAVAGAVALLAASWAAWRRRRGVPAGTLARRIQIRLDRHLTVVVWLSGAVAVMVPLIALSRVRDPDIYTGDFFQGCDAPGTTVAVLDECRQVSEDLTFAISEIAIFATALVLVWVNALLRAHPRQAPSAGNPQPTAPVPVS